MIILTTKHFAEDQGKEYWKDTLKRATVNDRNSKNNSKPNENNSSGEQKKYQPRPNKKKDSKLKKLQEDTAGVQRDIDIIKAEEEFKRKKEELDNLVNPKKSKFEKFKDNVKSKVSDPKVKKGLKYAGIGTAIAAGTAGAVYGGIKLKKKLDQKRSNKKIKEQIAGEDNE